MDGTVLVTGGTGALGSAVTDAFLEEDWRVAATWLVPEERERAGEREGLELLQANLLDEGEVERAVSKAASGGPPLRAVVNLVGGYAGGKDVHESKPGDFELQYRLNVWPTYLVTRASLPHLIEAGGGSVVCVSARAAVQPFAGAAGYISSKAAVLAFARAVAVEYRDRAVRCNAVLPSVIDTHANRASQPDADHSRWVAPAAIARVIRYLCSEDSGPISGAAVPVYGRA